MVSFIHVHFGKVFQLLVTTLFLFKLLLLLHLLKLMLLRCLPLHSLLRDRPLWRWNPGLAFLGRRERSFRD